MPWRVCASLPCSASYRTRRSASSDSDIRSRFRTDSCLEDKQARYIVCVCVCMCSSTRIFLFVLVTNSTMIDSTDWTGLRNRHTSFYRVETQLFELGELSDPRGQSSSRELATVGHTERSQCTRKFSHRRILESSTDQLTNRIEIERRVL